MNVEPRDADLGFGDVRDIVLPVMSFRYTGHWWLPDVGVRTNFRIWGLED